MTEHGSSIRETVVIHGGASGADEQAGTFCKTIKATEEIHLADWDRYGKKAGPIRNRHMVELGADVCLAFIKNNSRGASHCSRVAKGAGIPTKIFREND